MSYIKSSLIAGEQVVYRARHHWIMHLQKLVSLTLAGILVGVLCYFHADLGKMIVSLIDGMPEDLAALIPIGLAILIAFFALLGYVKFLLWLWSTEYAVTTRRVIMKHGLIRRRTFEVLLHQLESVSVAQGLCGRILGYGAFSLSGTGGARQTWSAIAQPLHFKKRIEATLEKEHRTPRAGTPDASPHVTPADDGPGTFRVVGVKREDGADAVVELQAQSMANARVKAELTGLIVTDVTRMSTTKRSR